MIALFENYSQTSDLPKSKVLPIVLKQKRITVFKKIVDYVTQEEYDDILPNKDFYEAATEQNEIREKLYTLDRRTPENQIAKRELATGKVKPIKL